MAQERLFNVSVSTLPKSEADLVEKANGIVTVHLAVNETAFGDSRSFSEFKATFHNVKPDAAKMLFAAVAQLLGEHSDQNAAQVQAIKAKVMAALAELDHTKTA